MSDTEHFEVSMEQLKNIEQSLKEKIGEIGIDYFYPQFEILKTCRNLPKDIDDVRLITEKFYLSLNLIRLWLAPVSEIVQKITEDTITELFELQEKAKALLEINSIMSWKEATDNKEISELFDKIKQKKEFIENLQQKVLQKTKRNDLTYLLGLLIYPFSGDLNLEKAIQKASRYYGPNILYKKQNVYTDAIIFMLVAQRLFKKQKGFVATTKTIEDKVDRVLRDSWYLEAEAEEWERYRITQGREGKFSERQIEVLVKEMLGVPRLTSNLRRELKPHYIASEDRYRIGGVMEWLIAKQSSNIHQDNMMNKLQRRNGINSARQQNQNKHKFRRQQRYLLGLSFMDKHRDTEIAGNIPESSVRLFESVLQPFNELKQSEIFMQSAQFSIDAFGLPEQAWIYDYTGIKSEILRSTLLLISDRQPKFDVLEACQRFSSAVLGGRVDRNDKREGRYVYTDLLTEESWNFIGEVLIKILVETLVKEENKAVRIIKEIFAEEDRSQIITNRKYVPIFQVELQRDQTGDEFNEISVYKRKGFEFQYRHAQAAGYPWFPTINSLLEDLVVNALNVKKDISLESKVNLKQVVFKVDEEAFIVIYHPHADGLKTLAFKEVDILEQQDVVSAVEILYRPRLFIEKAPHKNNLEVVLDKVRATDPKDLQTIISNL